MFIHEIEFHGGDQHPYKKTKKRASQVSNTIQICSECENICHLIEFSRLDMRHWKRKERESENKFEEMYANETKTDTYYWIHSLCVNN